MSIYIIILPTFVHNLTDTRLDLRPARDALPWATDRPAAPTAALPACPWPAPSVNLPVNCLEASQHVNRVFFKSFSHFHTSGLKSDKKIQNWQMTSGDLRGTFGGPSGRFGGPSGDLRGTFGGPSGTFGDLRGRPKVAFFLKKMVQNRFDSFFLKKWSKTGFSWLRGFFLKKMLQNRFDSFFCATLFF